MAIASLVFAATLLPADPAPAPEPPALPPMQAPTSAPRRSLRPVAPRPCRIIATGVKPVVEVAAKKNRAPFALFPIGFSKGGRFGWLESSQGFDDDAHSWTLHVVDLGSDRSLVDRVFFERKAGVAAMCDKNGAAIERSLARYDIAFGTPPLLEQPDSTRSPSSAEVVAGRRDTDALKTPYRVVLRSSDGLKSIGVLWQVEEESGEPARSKPAIQGVIRSPFEPRVAVVVTQKVAGTEGVEATMVTILGARLDRGWRKDR